MVKYGMVGLFRQKPVDIIEQVRPAALKQRRKNLPAEPGFQHQYPGQSVVPEKKQQYIVFPVPGDPDICSFKVTGKRKTGAGISGRSKNPGCR
jgi:hypothetical protein